MQYDSKEIGLLCQKLGSGGIWGYGVLCVLLQKLESTKSNKLEINSYTPLALYSRIDLENFKKLMKICFELKILETDGEYFWSEYVNKKVAEINLRKLRHSKAGKKGMEKRWNK